MKVNNLPKKIAVFPLSNAIFFPRTLLPLNIFENRYLQMVNDCIKGERIFGMIQPKKNKKLNLKKINAETYEIGCLGKIVNFSETEDNRFIITLLGLTRFKIINEINNDKLYREFIVDYTKFNNDLDKNKLLKLNTKNLFNKIKIFFKKKGYSLNWNELENLDNEQMINTICMVAPLSAEEKQKLLESESVENQINVLEEIINFNLKSQLQSEIKTIN